EGADDLVVDVARLPCAVVDVGAIRLAGSAFDAPSAKIPFADAVTAFDPAVRSPELDVEPAAERARSSQARSRRETEEDRRDRAALVLDREAGGVLRDRIAPRDELPAERMHAVRWAEEHVRDVGDVAAAVDEDAAARAVASSLPVRRVFEARELIGEPAKRGGDHAAERAVLDAPSRDAIEKVGAQGVCDRKRPLRARRALEHAVAFLGRRRHRLLAENVFPR